MKKARDESIVRRPIAFAGRTTVIFGGCFFILYAAFHGHCAFPIASAGEIVDCAGLGATSHLYPPLMQLLGHLLALLPLGLETTTRFHLLSAALMAFIAGAGAGMVQYWCTVFLGEDPERQKPAVGGFIAALAFAAALLASRPIWLAGTRFFSVTLAVALFVGALLAFTGFVITDRKRLLLITGGLLGLAAVESAEAAALVPCFALWAILRENNWGSKYSPSVRFILFFASLFVGALLGLVAIVAGQTWFGTGLGAAPLLSALSDLVSHHRQELLGVVTLHSCMPYLVLGGLTAALAILLSRQVARGETSKSCILLIFPILVGVLYSTFGGRWTFWYYASMTGRLPLYSALAVAAAFAFLVIACYALYSAPLEAEEADDEEDEDDYGHGYAIRCRRRLGLVLLPFAMAGICALVGWRFFRSVWNVNEGNSAQTAADAVLDLARTRHWIVSDGLLDSLLTLRAEEREQPILILSPQNVAEARFRRKIKDELIAAFDQHLQLRLQAMLEHDFNSFLTELFQQDAQIAEHALCLGEFSWLWRLIGQETFSAPSCTIGATASVPAPTAEAWQPSLKALKGDARNRELSGFTLQLRRRLSCSANNRGVECDLAGDWESARGFYNLARSIQPSNNSALVNLLGLAANGHLADEETQILLQKFQRTLAGNRQPLIRHWLDRDGLILEPPRTGAPASDTAPQGISRHQELLYRVQSEMLDRFRQSDLKNARRILEAATRYGMKEEELHPEWTYYHIVNGDNDKAGDLLLLGKEISDLPHALQAVLGYRYIHNGDLQYASSYMLPLLAGSLHGRDQFYVYLLRALLGLAQNTPSGLKEAQASYRMAAKCHPESQLALLPAILRCDLKANDLRSAEISALHLLQQIPDDPFGNLALGVIREIAGLKSDALKYYLVAAASKDDAVAARQVERLRAQGIK